MWWGGGGSGKLSIMLIYFKGFWKEQNSLTKMV